MPQVLEQSLLLFLDMVIGVCYSSKKFSRGKILKMYRYVPQRNKTFVCILLTLNKIVVFLNVTDKL